MKKICAFLLMGIGLAMTNLASTGCVWFLLDEPEMPNSLL
ncbi:MAG: cyclic lactone autoinducer peptide [Bacilli bacterium]|nr:cyclic lactone autoinducer peptide [Bacilli bacterium]